MVHLHSNVKILISTSALLSAFMGIAYPYFSEYVYALTGSAFVAGSVAFIRNVMCVCIFILGGYLADVVGRKRLIWVGTMLLGIAQLLYAAASSTYELICAALFEGVSFFYFPAFNAMIMDSTPDEELLNVFTLGLIASHLPYMASPLVGGILRDTYGVFGLRLGFALFGLVTLTISAIRLKMLFETLDRVEKVKRGMFIKAYMEVVEYFRRLRNPIKKLLALRSFLLLSAIFMLELFAVLYVTRYANLLSFTEWGLVQALASLAFLAALPLSKLISGWRPPLIYAALIVMEASTPLLILTNLRPMIFLSLALLNVCGALTYSIERTLIAKLVEPVMRGRAEGFMNISLYVGAAIGSMLGGYLFSVHPPFLLLAASFSLILGATLSPMIFKDVKLSQREVYS
ncbi:MAG: hypothetical protein DRJ98_01990 [Thermoprotei archaeon]|nr:MAG: hypothetical protein DRJ98_01990 [Thermoprotei archaeon]RLF18761.1 MAG: hypothetical protein DRN06_00560 [Thermoprotei archaeon]